MKLVQQDYAQHAYESITQARDKSYGQQYGRLCHAFPSMVLQNGLLLSVAFFKAKSKTKQDVYTQFLIDIGITIGKADFHEIILKNEIGTSVEYLRISKEILAASVWFKRYAEAILKVSASAASDLGGGGDK
ncbi:type III-B CRISPR module-associated protein Cmr5 [Paenibacillus campi]|uniref:type III-B CRISPR module-associated protein Cmr5 n=1 Tax=Paenibacillus campi TaxID=3106031 RepID=UPI002AFFECCA|nr:type III-B CRISPR module-associated protein Cmr5 [Paenibacillus sp. SGZ-1014]